ncbi:hypothetical protein [Alteromonas halophila]|uniref:Uncharacterized protein n=1 Tax=Alteromonas halophila TaxID=516698 RepID=A0A918MWU4_9ALTE|nr:hypothetical protein [Alteromonas halophila]GGW79748.1 hypothetical protein GCM10007391_10700 [Alteromonas halophila]
MESSDIKDYLKAKKGMAMAKVASTFLLLFVFAFPFYDKLGITNYLPFMAPMFAMLLVGYIWFGVTGVSEQTLLNIIERQISKDPEAIQRLSKHDT